MKKLFVLFAFVFTLFGITTNAHAVAVSGVEYPFSITTTYQSSTSWEFDFGIAAKGKFYVDCGDGGTLAKKSGTGTVSGGTTITQNAIAPAVYKCTYTSAGAKTIRFASTNVTQMNGSYSSIIFTDQGYYSIPSSNAELIASMSGDLTAVFPYISSTRQYYPVFRFLFYNCTNLTGYIPPSLFSGLITIGSPSLSNELMKVVFQGSGLDTSCPTGTTQYITGYEDKWSNKVSCGESIACSSGTYLPANATSCSSCPSGKTCLGGTFAKNAPTDQGIYYTVTYSCGDGAGTPPASTNTTRAYFTTAANTCTRTGYGFNNWLISGTSTTVSANTTFQWLYAENKTLTAQWTANTYAARYNCGDGSGDAPATQIATYDSSFTPAENTCTPPTGKHFTGWLIGGTNTTVSSAFIWNYASGKVLTAQYSPNTISMTWDGSSGTPASCTYGGTFTPPTPAARPGYIFNGWKVKTVTP